ncbi:MAG: hypothetical protein ACPLZD_05630 [Candidatus Saccharicenans sp.]|nr:MAG: hypothetical protein C0168_00595 [Candidatus Aminicenantes bacterium]HEK84795.1 hypothetical protein [Candidatus Aminicenantes bacterium]
MKEELSYRQEYYQKIARSFLQHNSSMFFLPPRDLALISEWEKMNIPLEAILEGIDRTFGRQLTRKRKKNIFSLSQCEKEVFKAYAQYQERLVGLDSPQFSREEKLEKVRTEINNFLQQLSSEIQNLKEYFLLALELLDQNPPDEYQLEKLDEEIDGQIWALIPESEKKASLEEIKKDYPGQGQKQLSEIQRVVLIKKKRQIHKIPYVSPFYY